MTTHITAATMARPAPRARQSGFTLIEMMISITIGLGILAGLVGVLATNASNSRSNDRTAELGTNGRYALNSMKQELREAGFRGYTWAEPGAPGPWTAPANASGCFGAESGASAGAFIANIRQGVWGSNNANPFAATCIPAASFANGEDVLVVRRLAITPTPTASLAANTVYFRTTYERGQVFRSTAVPVAPDYGASRPVANFAVQVYVYYISPFTVSAAEVPQVPALMRMALLTNGTMARELVARGIEHMQVQYGRLETNATTQYFDTMPNGSSETATDWEQVNSVRIWLLARSASPEPGYANTTTYAMGDLNFTAADGFRRQLFSTVVQLRN